MRAAAFVAELDVLIDRAVRAGLVEADEAADLKERAADLATVYRAVRQMHLQDRPGWAMTTNGATAHPAD